MTFQEFIQTWTGEHVDVDGVYADQCMDLMHEYIIDVLDITDIRVLAESSAYQVYEKFDTAYGHEMFERIENTPTNVPQNGDIVVFDQRIGIHGHVCIFIEGDTHLFKSFDANWPLNSLPHVQSHDYRGVAGWLRFKKQHMVEVPDDIYPDIIHGSTQWDNTCNDQQIGDPKHTEYDKLKSVIAGYKSRITDTQNQLTAATATTSNLEEQISRLKDQLTKETEMYSEVSGKLNDTLKKYSDITTSYEGRIKGLQDQVDQLGKEKGDLVVENAQLKQGINNMSIFDLLQVIVSRLTGRK